jgi:hypothetical protein
MMGEGVLLAPESALLKGDLLVAIGDAEAATVQFQRVFHTTGELGLRMPQLQSWGSCSSHRSQIAQLAGPSGLRTLGQSLLREPLRCGSEGRRKDERGSCISAELTRALREGVGCPVEECKEVVSPLVPLPQVQSDPHGGEQR